MQTLPQGEMFAYPVDAGTGCFMDWATMEALLAEAGIADIDDWRSGPSGHLTPQGNVTSQWTTLVDAVYDWDEAFSDRLLEQLEAANYTAAVITAENGANLIAFSSGWGDGGYASFFGYDTQDALVCLVTDFQVLHGAT